MSSKQDHDIETTVTFAAAERPYHHTYDPATAIGDVLTDALKSFGITSDGTSRYYLLHDGVEVPPTSTVGEVAGHAHGLRLALRTETIQGLE